MRTEAGRAALAMEVRSSFIASSRSSLILGTQFFSKRGSHSLCMHSRTQAPLTEAIDQHIRMISSRNFQSGHFSTLLTGTTEASPGSFAQTDRSLSRSTLTPRASIRPAWSRHCRSGPETRRAPKSSIQPRLGRTQPVNPAPRAARPRCNYSSAQPLLQT
jgi:hypothetical protein